MRLRKLLVLSFAALFLFFYSTSDASAKVMWGKTELKKGQIGKVTVLSNVNAVKVDGKTATQDKRLKKGDEYRIYSYRVLGGNEYYGLGGGLFVQKSTRVKYETPSKKKLAELEREANGIVGGFDVTKIYEFEGTGEYKGYKGLIGYPDDDKYTIYYSGNFESYHVTYEDLYPKNLQEKITWKYKGKTYTHTRSQLYSFFSDIIKLESLLGQSKGIINQNWLSQTFGKTYDDWIMQGIYSQEAARIVHKYLDYYENPNQVDRYEYSDFFDDKYTKLNGDGLDISVWISSKELSANVDGDGDVTELSSRTLIIEKKPVFIMAFTKSARLTGTTKEVIYDVPDMPLDYLKDENDSEDTFNGIRFKKVNKNVYMNIEDLKAKGVL